MIELNNVSLFSPEGKYILKKISWNIKAGENWILFGRNGSGKTRLLDIIAGFTYPSSGRVNRFGFGQSDADLRELKKHIGFVSSTLKDRLPARDRLIDIVISGSYATIGLYEEPDKSEKSYAVHLLGLTGLEGRENDPFGILSDGEKQKVLMVRAMINNPELLILDEPAMGLDLKNREDLLSGIDKISTLEKASIIYVTHHPDEILPIFNNLLLLKDGEVCFNGPMTEGMRAATLQHVFETEVSLEKFNDRYICRIL